MGKGVRKVQRQSIPDQVYDILVKKITDGEWKEGEKIPSEIELAEQLGVSRVTLKIALQKMNTLGVLDTRIGEGSFVCKSSIKSFFTELFSSNILEADVNQVNDFRILLEFCNMRLAVLNPDREEKLARLREMLDKMKQALDEDNYSEYHDAHFRFHTCICEMAGNPFFSQLYDSINEVFYDIYEMNSEKTWGILGKNESILHHEEILIALEQGNIQKLFETQDILLMDKIIKS